jgi:hypothetical protein
MLQFLRFLPIFGEKMAILSKTNDIIGFRRKIGDLSQKLNLAITIFCNFYQFSAKKLVIPSKKRAKFIHIFVNVDRSLCVECIKC